jgi:hypothetical protein
VDVHRWLQRTLADFSFVIPLTAVRVGFEPLMRPTIATLVWAVFCRATRRVECDGSHPVCLWP